MMQKTRVKCISTPIPLEGKLGKGFTGTQDVDVGAAGGETLDNNDSFGRGVALDDNRLVVGANSANGQGNSGGGYGEVHIFPISHYEVADGSDFDNSTTASQINGATSSTNITIWPSTLVSVLSNGTNITLQANNDITVNQAITAANGKNRGRHVKTACGNVHAAASLTTHIHGSARGDPVGTGDCYVATFRVSTLR